MHNLVSLAPIQIHTSEVTEVTTAQPEQPGHIYNSTNNESVNLLIIDKGVCRTAPATLGLLIMFELCIPPLNEREKKYVLKLL